VNLELEHFELDDVPWSFDTAAWGRVWFIARANGTNYPSVRLSIFDSGGDCQIPTVTLISSTSYIQIDAPIFLTCGGNPLTEATINEIEILFRYQGVGTDALTILSAGFVIGWTETDYYLVAHGTMETEMGGDTYMEWGSVCDEALGISFWDGDSYESETTFCDTDYATRTQNVTSGMVFGGYVPFQITDANGNINSSYNVSYFFFVRSYSTTASGSWGGLIWLVLIGTVLFFLLAVGWVVRGKRGAMR